MSRGRKNLYFTKVQPYITTIEGMYREGYGLQEIADYLGIALSTLCNYKNQFPELDDALRRSNQDAVYAVENALYKSAIGYTYLEEEVNKKTGEIVTVQKYAKPNVNAQIILLKNRARNIWSDRQVIQADVNQCVIFEGEDDIKD